MTLWASNPALGTHLPEIRTAACQDICGRILTEALFVTKGRGKGKVHGCRTTMPQGSLQPLILSQNNRETWGGVCDILQDEKMEQGSCVLSD